MEKSTFSVSKKIGNYQLDNIKQTICDLPGVENVNLSNNYNEITVTYDETLVNKKDIVESILLSKHIF